MYAEEKDVLKYDHMAEDEVPQDENQTKKDSWTDRRSDKEANTIRHAASEVSH